MVVGRSPGLEELFLPQSIAVVGASGRPGSVGHSLFQNLLRSHYRGVVFPVNPTWKSIDGVRCFPSVTDLPEAPDLGVVIVPATAVPDVVHDLGRAGTRGVVVISAGFRELGAEGALLEDRLTAEVRRYSMSLVGPNCFGIINTDPAVGLNATFSEKLPPRGRIAFISQSGALCAGILHYGLSQRIGFSRFVSMGNRAGVDENDLLASMAADPATGVILLYVESLADGRRFLEAARQVTKKKPVLVIKSGRTAAGERAARSHTGSIAQSSRDRLFDALFEQSGVIRADSIGDLFRMAKVFGAGLQLRGPRLAILTNSGGPGIVAADAAARRGMDLPVPSPTLARRLQRRLPHSATIANPLDMTADGTPPLYAYALRTLLHSPEIDAALVITTPAGIITPQQVAEAILAGRTGSRKPVVACLFGLDDLSHAVTFLEEAGVPTFTFPEDAVQGLSGLTMYQKWRERPKTRIRHFAVDLAGARAVVQRARKAGLTDLPEYRARALLEAYGIRFPAHGRAQEVEEAVAIAEEIGYPVVLKVASGDVSHKTDVGGVALDLTDAPTLRSAFAKMRASLARRAPKARIDGFEVEQQVPAGPEVLIGLQRDPNFGPLLVFGLGGIYVEAFKDVTFRLAPVVSLSARNMVRAVRGFPVLQGMRGGPPGDLPALYEAIERVSQLAMEIPDVAELDLNPMIVRPAGEGIVAVDARVVLGPPSTRGPRA
jgi:acetyltransferase